MMGAALVHLGTETHLQGAAIPQRDTGPQKEYRYGLAYSKRATSSAKGSVGAWTRKKPSAVVTRSSR